MHFRFGRSKEKPEKEKVDIGLKDVAADHIEKMEKRIYGKAKDLEEKTQQIQGLTERNADVPPGPHGPIGELTLEADDATDLAALTETGESDDEDGVRVKLVEVSAASAPPPVKTSRVNLDEAKAPPAKSSETAKGTAAAPGQEAKPGVKQEINLDVQTDVDVDSLGSLFNQNEEETNPLANLINSLPDVTVGELIDDLNEIKRIIKEWQPK